MNKKENNESANVFKEKLAKGQEFLDSFTAEDLFEKIKKIVRKHISKDGIPSLDSCTFYRLVINEKKLREIYFNFGGILNGYEITLNACSLTIQSRSPYHYGKLVYSCCTCDLTKD